jgi:hypothetical protein
MLKIFFLLIIIYFCTMIRANAYIDPGTGSILLQALLGGLAAAGASIVIYWNKLKNFIFKNKKKNDYKIEDEK